MTKRRLRIWVTATSLLALSAIVLVIAMHPWPQESAAADRRLGALERREYLLKRQARQVERVLQRRWKTYELRLAVRQREISEARRRYEAQVAAAHEAAVQRAQVLAAIAEARAEEQSRTATATGSTTTPARATSAAPSATPVALAPAAPTSAPTTAAPAPAAPAPSPPPVAVVALPPVTVSTTS